MEQATKLLTASVHEILEDPIVIAHANRLFKQILQVFLFYFLFFICYLFEDPIRWLPQIGSSGRFFAGVCVCVCVRACAREFARSSRCW
jgi:hypothetical protein